MHHCLHKVVLCLTGWQSGWQCNLPCVKIKIVVNE